MVNVSSSLWGGGSNTNLPCAHLFPLARCEFQPSDTRQTPPLAQPVSAKVPMAEWTMGLVLTSEPERRCHQVRVRCTMPIHWLCRLSPMNQATCLHFQGPSQPIPTQHLSDATESSTSASYQPTMPAGLTCYISKQAPSCFLPYCPTLWGGAPWKDPQSHLLICLPFPSQNSPLPCCWPDQTPARDADQHRHIIRHSLISLHPSVVSYPIPKLQNSLGRGRSFCSVFVPRLVQQGPDPRPWLRT